MAKRRSTRNVSAGPKRYLVFVHGAAVHRKKYSDCWWRSFESHLCFRDYTRVEVLWNNSRGVANCSDRVFPGDWIEVNAQQMRKDVDNYLTGDLRRKGIEEFTAKVQPLLKRSNRVDIICHSLGTLLAYEALTLLGKRRTLPPVVHNLFTVGSVLTWPDVQGSLIDEADPNTPLRLVKNWWNVMDTGDFAHLLASRRRVGTHYAGVSYDFTRRFMTLNDLRRCRIPQRLNFARPCVCGHFYYFDRKNLAVNDRIFAKRLDGR